MANLTRGGWLKLFRTLAPPNPDSDADLLARFVRERSELALDTLVRRYAGMVMGVCRRRFGDSSDAEDAFQATFLVFARNADRISRGTSLPGWLYRVAYLTSLKLAGQLHRRGNTPMETEPVDLSVAPPEAAAERHEAKAILDEELAALSEKFRVPVVLCCLEGKTNAEAAAILGIPVGTVESRLHTAKEKIRSRLLKRGLTGSALSLTAAAGINASEDLIQRTVHSAMAFALGSDIAGSGITTLANEVSSTMTTSPLKMLAATAMVLTLAGGIGTGVYLAKAGDDPQKPAAKAKQVEPPPKKSEPPTKLLTSDLGDIPIGSTAATTAILSKQAGFDKEEELTVAQIFELLSERFHVTFRIENVQALKTFGIENPYEKSVKLRFTKGLTVQDILDEIVHELMGGNQPSDSHEKIGFRVKGNQVLLGRVFVPPTAPSTFQNNDPMMLVPTAQVYNMLYGPTVSLSVKDKTLKEVVDILREQTGSNIVINENYLKEGDKKITLTLSDTKLFTVLKVVSDMYDMAPAVVDNVFYITDPQRAMVMNSTTSMSLFGK